MSRIINGCFGEPCEVPDSALKDQGGFVRAMAWKADNQRRFMQMLKPFNMAVSAAVDTNMVSYNRADYQDPDHYSRMDTPEV